MESKQVVTRVSVATVRAILYSPICAKLRHNLVEHSDTGVYMVSPRPQVNHSLVEENELLSKQGTNILATFRDKHDNSAGKGVSRSIHVVVGSIYWR